MSFSSDVKDELYEKLPAARHCRIALLLALKRFAGDRDEKGKLLSERLTEALGGNYPEFDKSVIFQDCCKRVFLRGAFLGVGTLSSPEKSYDLEFVCVSGGDAELISGILLALGINHAVTIRKSAHVVYIHDGDCVSELLGLMEAHKGLLALENVRVVKELRGDVNRRVNCETANLTKQAMAFVKQKEAIESLMRRGEFSGLSDSLREIAEKRLEYPDASLEELGQMLSTPLGKSGVNHRLRRIVALAEREEAGGE